MSRVQVRVRGASDFVDANRAYIQQAIAQANRGLDLAVETVQAEAEAHCPVGTPESTGIPGYQGGTLRDGHAVMPDQEDHRYIRYLYNDVHYAMFVHEGTYKMPARPWLLNAVESTKTDVAYLMLKA